MRTCESRLDSVRVVQPARPSGCRRARKDRLEAKKRMGVPWGSQVCPDTTRIETDVDVLARLKSIQLFICLDSQRAQGKSGCNDLAGLEMPRGHVVCP